MGEIIKADKSFFKKQANLKKAPLSLEMSSLLDELQEEMKPEDKTYENKIQKQIIELIKKNYGFKIQKTSKNILFEQEGTKSLIFIPSKKVVIHLIFNKTQKPTNIKDKFDHYYLDLTKFPEIHTIEEDVLNYIK
ncbi:hypothetical protein [Acinetobacter pollinis]|jgi:hypothetical protein|uniref:hypothetical protein n=1 Tax=Acinetobacter pollinis TaxID=2605270 RepID=UPI0018C1E746|nr:hypothetical protein [Acinetobacter pollinis]MBF7694211.1 hypothetical protein [Acinetobacter pollinis]MBF7701803.1 hypothetical protein [Acinetobacter pollinis]